MAEPQLLTRQPVFLIVAVLTLALGIGANTAIFSVVKAVLLEPLAYREPERVVAVQTLWTKTNRAGNISGGDYTDLIAEPSSFTAASRYAGGELPIEVAGQAEFVAAYGTDAAYADVFQLKPAAGRLITPDEFRTKAAVAVVSESFAVRHFGEKNRALGQMLRFEGSALSVVGVLPAGFHFPLNAVLRQLLVESALLGMAGGAIGLVFAFSGVGVLLRIAPVNLPRLEEVRVDP